MILEIGGYCDDYFDDFISARRHVCGIQMETFMLSKDAMNKPVCLLLLLVSLDF